MQSNKKLEIFDLTKGYSSFLIAGKEPELLGNILSPFVNTKIKFFLIPNIYATSNTFLAL